MMAWAQLRQVVLATDDIALASKELRATYRLPDGFADPQLDEHGIADESIPLGPVHYLELVSPTGLDAAGGANLARWLTKRGGQGGYCLSVQVPDAHAARERALARGVRVVADQDVLGHRIIQLHPADAGVLLELDGIADRGSWFWDDITPGPASDAVVDALLGVTIAVADPPAVIETWLEVVDVPRIDANTLDLGVPVTFVVGGTPGIVAVDLRLAAGEPPREDATVLGVLFRHHAAV